MGVPQGRRARDFPNFLRTAIIQAAISPPRRKGIFLLKSGRILLFEQESGMGTLLDEGANLTLLPLPLPHLCLFLKGLFYLERNRQEKRKM